MTDPNPFATWLTSDAFSGIWVPVAQSRSVLIGPPYINGVLAQPGHGEDPSILLSSTESPVHDIGRIYGTPARDDGTLPEFLASEGAHHGAATFWPFACLFELPGGHRYLEPLQQFLTFHAAWPTRTREQSCWYRLHDGKEQPIARWTRDASDRQYSGTLEIYRPALLKYLHHMNLHFAFFFDVRANGDGVPDDWRAQAKDARRSWRAWNTPAAQLLSDHAQAMMLGVEILRCPEDDPEPEDDRQAGSVEFLVAFDPDTGKPVTVSFPGAPNPWTEWPGAGNDNFLTHLYFSTRVLERYHADTRLYTVTNGHVSAWDGWGLQISLTEQGNYHAYLGDVAKLPRYEQEHWAGHAVVGDRIPENRARADFFGQFVDGPSHRTVVDDLRSAHAEVNSATEARFGASLLPLVEPINEPKVRALRVPTNEVTSFQAQLTALSLLLGDSLDSKTLTAAGAPKVENAGTLKRLELMLENLTGRGGGGVRDDIAALIEVQTLRSHIGGVHDTSKAEKTLARYNASDLAWDDWFVDIVERATAALRFIADTIRATSDTDTS
jgi:hypothetical protein